MTAVGFSTLTFEVEPVVVQTNVSGAALAFAENSVLTGATSGSPVYVAAILDPNTKNFIFNPVAEGNNVVAGSAGYAAWLPSLQASPTYTTLTDNYWAPVLDLIGDGSDAPIVFGMVTLKLTPAANNVVESPSVMSYKVSPNALVIVATAGNLA